MKNQLIGLVFVALLMSGCVTQKRCEQKFPQQIITIDSVITKTETIYRDTTIFIELPGDTIRDTVEVTVKEGIANSRPSIHETDLAWSMAQVVNGFLRHELIQKDSTLARVIENAIRESATTTEKNKIQTRIVEKNYITGWQWFQIWLGRMLMALAAMFVGYVIIRSRLKLP
jgi:hypothetical protein